MKYALSFHVGGELNHDHNARRTIADYVHTERMNNNRVIERDPAEVIGKWYEEELREENAKKKPSRRIENLYEHYKRLYDNAKERDRELSKNKQKPEVKKYRNKAKSPEKEIIIQIGDKDNRPPDEIAEKILIKYVNQFQRNNPCMRITGAYIHMDEASPHLHLDIVYKADQEPTISKMYSFENALKQQGYERKREQEQVITPFEQWMKAQRAEIQEIGKEYGIDIAETKKEEKRKHLSREVYIIKKETEKLHEKERELTEKAEKYAEKEQKMNVKMAETEKRYREIMEGMNMEINKGKKEIDRLQTELTERYEEVDRLEAELTKRYEEMEALKRQKELYEKNAMTAMIKAAENEVRLDKIVKNVKNYCKPELAKKILIGNEEKSQEISR